MCESRSAIPCKRLPHLPPSLTPKQLPSQPAAALLRHGDAANYAMRHIHATLANMANGSTANINGGVTAMLSTE